MNKPTTKEYHCPKCNRIIYDRSNPLCGYCGGPLPKEFMLSTEEIAAIKKEKAELEAESLKTKEEQGKVKSKKLPNNPMDMKDFPESIQ